jgi:hypothetical protein
MTKEEQTQFKDKVAQTILPIAVNMTEDQIRSIIILVEQENPELPGGFGAMLFEQIMVHKYNKTTSI